VGFGMAELVLLVLDSGHFFGHLLPPESVQSQVRVCLYSIDGKDEKCIDTCVPEAV